MTFSTESHNFTIRLANVEDVRILARHRCEMFLDMGPLKAEAYPILAQQSQRYFEQTIPTGEYLGWLAAPHDQPDLIVAGAGLQLRPIMPSPDFDGNIMPPAYQGYILNVYTEKEWRRKGLAEALVNRILEWCRENNIVELTLHSSDMGRPLYKKLSFVASNEMRFDGQL